MIYKEIRSFSNDLLNILDELVLRYQKNSESDISSLQRYNRISISGMLVILLIEVLYVFRPLLRALYKRERKYQLLLTKMNEKISEQVRNMAFNDTLTGLPNRHSIFEKIQTLIQIQTKRYNKVSFVVISLSLTRMKEVNNLMGHDYGDKLIIEFSANLKSFAKQLGGFAGRITGDEFSIVLEKENDSKKLVELMSKFSTLVNETAEKYCNKIQMKAAIGIALYPDDGTDARTLLRHANQAMSMAKIEGGSALQFFQPEMILKIERRIYLERKLYQAMNNHMDSFSLHYQPKINLKTGLITGVEALLRWTDPDEGQISPDEFIPIAEESGLILDLGEWILIQALKQTKVWRDQGLDISININFSVVQLLRADISKRVIDIVETSEVSPEFIHIEITESNAISNIDEIMHQLNELAAYGFILAIDDFGTGHSSLSRLRDMPVSILKIDKSFVFNSMLDIKDMQVIKAIIEMGHSLGKQIVAEGIETVDQLSALQNLGCDEGQGFLFSKPRPVCEITNYLNQGQIDFAAEAWAGSKSIRS